MTLDPLLIQVLACPEDKGPGPQSDSGHGCLASSISRCYNMQVYESGGRRTRCNLRTCDDFKVANLVKFDGHLIKRNVLMRAD